MKFNKLRNLSFLLILASNAFHCMQPSSSGEDPALALFLLSQEPSQAQVGNGECALRDNATVSTGANEVQVNASSTRCWMLVSLRSGATQVAPGGDWDLRFRRFVIGTNSGQSGGGSGGACDTGLADFGAVTAGNQGPCSNSNNFQVDSVQTQDAEGFADVNDSASPVLFNWYDYQNARLKAKDNVYIIRGANGTSFFKLQMTNYYSEAGTSGFPRFLWGAL